MKNRIPRAGASSPGFSRKMTIPVNQQISAFLLAALSGASFALIYDLFAALRCRFSSRLTTALLDGIYCLSVAAALFLFTLHLGNGRPRLYLLIAIALGAAAYFSLPAAFFRPVWNFWLGCFLLALSFLDIPRRFLLQCIRKTGKICKTLFYFGEKYAIILFCKPRSTKETHQWRKKRPQKRKKV